VIANVLDRTVARLDREEAEALFERIDAVGFREATLRLTNSAIARGFAAVIPERLEPTVGYGRGERARASAPRQIRGCRVTVGGRRGPVDPFLTA